MRVNKNSLVIIIAIFFTTVLSACGGGDGNGNTNELTVDVQTWDQEPVRDAVVQINNETSAIKTTDDSGKVVFNVAENSTNDIHVFAPTGYNWYSVYGTDKRNIEVYLHSNTPITTPSQGSYIYLTGTLSNYKPDSSYKYSLLINNNYYQINNVGVINGRYDITAYLPFAVGTAVNREFIIYERSVDTITGQNMLTDSVSLGALNYVTVAPGGQVIEKNISLNSPKPVLDTLLTVNSIQFPSGMTFTSTRVGQDSQDYSELKSPATNPSISYKSYLSQNSDTVTMRLSASRLNRENWYYYNLFYTGETVDISPWLVEPAMIPEGQSGETISWIPGTINNPSQANLETKQNIYIFPTVNAREFLAWEIYMPSEYSSITFPDLPDGVTPILSIGTEYTFGVAAYANYMRTINNNDNPKRYRSEIITSELVSWTR